MKKCLLVDGSNLIFRAHYALEKQNLKTRSGKASGALYGFTRMLLRLLREENPDFAGVAFDIAKETFRRRLFPEYKANRRPTPQEIIEQLPYAHRLVQILGICLLTDLQFEADDLIGSAARIFRDFSEVKIVTGDRDLLQLIGKGVSVKLCSKGISEFQDFDREVFFSQYGFEPLNIIDLKALWGDSSDNIPGVNGIGEKKAMALIKEFGTIENLFESLEKVSNPKMREQLLAGRDSAMLSKKLATIECNITHLPGKEMFEWKGIEGRNQELRSFFAEWNFTTLLENEAKGFFQNLEEGKKTPEKSFQPSLTSAIDEEAAQPVQLKAVPGDFIYLNSPRQLHDRLSRLSDIICLDVETDGFNPFQNRIVGFSFACDGKEAAYVPLRHSYLGVQSGDQMSPEEAFQILGEHLRGKTLIGHNLKFDLAFLRNEGIEHSGALFDTMLAAYVLDPTTSNALKSLARDTLGIEAVEFREVAKNRVFSEVSIDEAVPYACHDAILTFLLYEKFLPELKSRKLLDVFENLEMPIIPLLTEMERTGIGVNKNYLSLFGEEISCRIRELEKSIHADAGFEFNVNSGKQLQEVLFEKLKLEHPRKTKTGYSTDHEVLKSLEGSHPIISKLLEFRELVKLKNTYVDSLAQLVEPKTGLIHTSFNQTVTATGRLSSSNPNLQNIPVKTELGRKVRRAFIPPREGDYFLSFDYSQIELRLLAHFSCDDELLRAYEENLDIHSITAAKLFNKNVKDVMPEERKIGKTVNFGIIYGISPHGLAQDLKINRILAKQYIDGFFRTFPKVTEYFESNLESARKSGQVKTLFGRVRPLPELFSSNYQTRAFGERIARNTPLQGSAADLVKKAMLETNDVLRKNYFETKLILQIHDELVFSCPKTEIGKVCPLLKRTMENVVRLNVPLVCDVSWGPNLADLEDWDL
jgi:DNA polymerase-1